MPLDSFWVESTQHATNIGTFGQSTMVLVAGLTYSITVDGNFTVWSTLDLPYGVNLPIKYPTAGQRDAAIDAEVYFASEAPGTYPSHQLSFRFDLGNGFIHYEPVGGPFSTIQNNHVYSYNLVGQGAVLKAAITDDPLTDNSGRLKVVIEAVVSWQVGSIRMGVFT